MLPEIFKSNFIRGFSFYFWVLSTFPWISFNNFNTEYLPVLKINNHATGGWRTKDILGGPKSLETKKLGSSKGWGDQSAKKTNNWRDKKYLMNRWGTKKLRTYVVGWFCWNLRAFWEDQTDQKSAVGGPKRILRTGTKPRTAALWRTWWTGCLAWTSCQPLLSWWRCGPVLRNTRCPSILIQTHATGEGAG